LAEQSVRLAVLSNKPHEATVRCVEEMLGGFPFEAVLGQREGIPRKPDPAGALEVAREMQLAPEQIAFLGDTAIDMETAVRARMFPVGVSWGFRPRGELTNQGAEVVIEHPLQFMDLLASEV
jgi:phosphoglycolate phosphatase